MSVVTHLCHVCTEREATTNEHVPPRSTGNRGEAALYDASPSGAGYRRTTLQDGFWRPSLCTACNTVRCNAHVAAYAALVEAISTSRTAEGWATVSVTLEPRRVIRQILTMFLAASSREPPFSWAPLRAFVLDDAALYARSPSLQELPKIYVFKSAGSVGRVIPYCEKWRLSPLGLAFVGAEFSLPPLGAVVSFGGGEVDRLGLHDITGWAECRSGARARVSLRVPELRPNGDMPLLFGDDDLVAAARDNHAVGRFAPDGAMRPGTLGAVVSRSSAPAQPPGDVVVLRGPELGAWHTVRDAVVERAARARSWEER